MPSFGERLKLEREKRKITLEQISASTKIGARMLQALEEDKFNQLPGGIFNKGFVRAYSRCVGLDEDQTVAEYLEASGDAPPVSTEIAARENAENLRRLEVTGDAPARQLPWGLFAALLLVVALALSLWSHRRREHTRQSDRPAPTTAAGQLSGGISKEDRGAGSPATRLPAARSAPSAQPSPVPASASSGHAPSVAGITPQNLAVAAPAATPGEFTVAIQAREESWVSITVDGRTAPSETFAAGSERTVRGRKEIIVKAGNAGGVDFRFNGRKVETGGDYGEVETVTFGPGGMLPNAPAPPSTP